MVLDAEPLPAWATWRHRPFPDANLLLLHGRQPALVDSGFVGHAQQTAAWTRAHTEQVALVVNTHWHSDHVGGMRCCRPRALGSRPAPRTLRPLPARPGLLPRGVPRPAGQPLHRR
jgi:glyoxylase-like metal-dependent hydrolase (beta-lactamase superfamily II)